MRRSRPAVILSLLLAGPAALPATASAAETCTFDAETHAVTFTGEGRGYTLERLGGAIRVRLPSGTVLPCGAATVTTTDTIEAAGTGGLDIDLKNGPFAPGFTGEGAGNSEIEIAVRGRTSIRVIGRAAAESIRLGVSGTEERFNLNAAEPEPDADVVADTAVRARVFSGDGDDVIDARGGAGTGDPWNWHLEIWAGRGNDGLHAGAASDRLDDYSFDYTDADLEGGEGDDTIGGGPYSDSIDPGTGNDTVDGSGGRDLLTFVERIDLSNAGPQDTGVGLDTVTGIEDVEGMGGPLRGDAGPNRIYGSSRDDLLIGGGGDDHLVGDEGEDTMDYSGASGPVYVDLRRYPPRYSWFHGRVTGADGSDTTAFVEHAILTPYADSFIGDGAKNRVLAGKGDDTVDGRYGADWLDAGDGADQVLGDLDNDMILPGTGATRGRDGADGVDGGKGVDTVSYAARGYPVAVRLDGVANDGADPNRNGVSAADEEADQIAGVENVTGGAGADKLWGPAGAVANVLLGGAGNDWMDGGLGADTLDGESGLDTVSYAGRTARVAIRLDGERNDGADPDGDGASEPGEEDDLVVAMENAIGGGGADTLVAPGAEVNVLTGGPGADFVDAFDGTSAVDRLSCGYGADTFRADPGDAKTSCESPAP